MSDTAAAQDRPALGAAALAPGGINPWIVAVPVMLGTFMEVLDTTIVNVALPHIAGSLSAGVDESTWTLTSYLVSNAIVLPATGWLARLFGRKRLFMGCIALFTCCSILSGLATSLTMLVVFRALQGLGGGALQPISQAILLESFPPKKRGMAMAVFAVGVVIAPIIGPTLGGWLTDQYSWRWCFYINLPVGMLALLLTQAFVFDPPYARRQRQGRIDVIGLGLLAVGLGCLQVVLDKGQREDWFSSPWLTKFAIVSGVSLVALVIWELRVRDPIVNLRALGDRNLAIGTILIFGFGLALYGSMVLYPIFLQTLLGYTALLSGLALSPGAVATVAILPFVGWLVGRIDARLLIAFGFGLVAIGLYMMSGFDLQVSFATVVWPRVVLGFGLAFCFVPLTTVTFATTSQAAMNNATGIYNLMRNIGGSVGIAMVTTVLARRSQFHQSVLAANVSPFNLRITAALQQWELLVKTHAPAQPSPGQPSALPAIYAELQRQAAMQAVVDVFWMMAVVAAALMIGLFFFGRAAAGKSPPSGEAPAVHAM